MIVLSWLKNGFLLIYRFINYFVCRKRDTKLFGDRDFASSCPKIIADLRMQMFSSMIAAPSQFFDEATTGKLVSKFTFDVTQVAQASTRVITVLVKDSVVILVLLGYLLYLNWMLATIFILIAPPIGLWFLRYLLGCVR